MSPIADVQVARCPGCDADGYVAHTAVRFRGAAGGSQRGRTRTHVYWVSPDVRYRGDDGTEYPFGRTVGYRLNVMRYGQAEMHGDYPTRAEAEVAADHHAGLVAQERVPLSTKPVTPAQQRRIDAKALEQVAAALADSDAERDIQGPFHDAVREILRGTGREA